MTTNTMKMHLPLILLLALVLAAPMTFAQQRSPIITNTVEVQYPGLVDREALVELEFTVKSDGSIADLKTVGGFHQSRFVEATMTAARQLQFQPATENGNAIDWPGYRMSGRFIVEDLFNTVNPAFSNRISQVENLIANANYDQARDQALDMLQNDTLYFYEYAYLHLRLSEIYLLTNQLFDAYEASLIATQAYRVDEHRNYGLESARMRDQFKVAMLFGSQSISDDTYISNELQTNSALVASNTITMPTQMVRPRHIRSSVRFSNWGSDIGDKPTMDVLNSMLIKDALQASVQVTARLGHIRPLLNDYERFTLEEPRVPDFLENISELAMTSLNSGAALRSSHRISNGQSLFFPYRRTVAVVGVDGNLDSVDIQCERNVIRMAFQAETEWQIPESWGECSLRFRGDEATTFSVIEFQD